MALSKEQIDSSSWNGSIAITARQFRFMDTHAPDKQIADLMSCYSLEITAKDTDQLQEACAAMSAGSLISVTFLPGESIESRVAASAQVRTLGMEPVPHISARRLNSKVDLEEFLDQLRDRADVRRAFVVAGDLAEPYGPYADALAVIRSGGLVQRGINTIGVAGYPEGHPAIDEPTLWAAIVDKYRALTEQGADMEIVTQFGFDREANLRWIEQLRQTGIESPVRIGIPGPASVKTLLRFAARCGVSTSTKVLSKYGLSITKLLSSAGPDRLISELANAIESSVHGNVGIHIYPFGGLKRATDWAREMQIRHGSASDDGAPEMAATSNYERPHP